MPSPRGLRSIGALRSLQCALLLAAGCAGVPDVAREPATSVSRDGVLRYQLPDGWFDATADSQAAGHAVWLLSNDYTMSVTVDQIRLDPRARADIGTEDLLRLSELVMSLVAADRSAQVVEEPTVREFNGTSYCMFALLTEAGETLHVAVMDTGERAYTATFFRASGAGGADLIPVERSFLGALRW